MPFTLAHPAAAFPLSRLWPSLPLSGLIIGSMAPDFEYLLRLRPFGSFAHGRFGLLLFSLPAALAVLLIVEHVVLPPLRRHAGLPFKRPSPVSPALFTALLLGVLSHVLWDSFTHPTGFFVRRISGLSSPLFLSAPLYKVLQHGSSLLGMILLASWFYPTARRLPAPAFAALCRLGAFIALAAVSLGLLNALRGASLRACAGYAAVGALSGGAVVVFLTALYFRWKQGN